MPDAQRGAEGAAGIARGRLNPNLIEGLLAQDAPVADAVQRDAAGQTQIAQAGLAPREARHLQHHFLGDVLNRSRKIHFTLRQL